VSGERSHPPVDPAAFAHHDRQGGALSRSLRAEFRTDRVFKNLGFAQAELDEWVEHYNTVRPHQGIGMEIPAQRFGLAELAPAENGVVAGRAVVLPADERRGEQWVARRAGANGVVSVNWQQVCLGAAAAGHNIEST